MWVTRLMSKPSTSGAAVSIAEEALTDKEDGTNPSTEEDVVIGGVNHDELETGSDDPTPRDLNREDTVQDAELRQAVRDRAEAPEDEGDAGSEKEPDFLPKPSPEEQKALDELTKRLGEMSRDERTEELKKRGITNAGEMAEQDPEAVAKLMTFLDESVERKFKKTPEDEPESKDPGMQELELEIKSLFGTENEEALDKVLDKIEKTVEESDQREELETFARRSADGSQKVPTKFRSNESIAKELEGLELSITRSNISKAAGHKFDGVKDALYEWRVNRIEYLKSVQEHRLQQRKKKRAVAKPKL